MCTSNSRQVKRNPIIALRKRGLVDFSKRKQVTFIFCQKLKEILSHFTHVRGTRQRQKDESDANQTEETYAYSKQFLWECNISSISGSSFLIAVSLILSHILSLILCSIFSFYNFCKYSILFSISFLFYIPIFIFGFCMKLYFVYFNFYTERKGW